MTREDVILGIFEDSDIEHFSMSNNIDRYTILISNHLKDVAITTQRVLGVFNNFLNVTKKIIGGESYNFDKKREEWRLFLLDGTELVPQLSIEQADVYKPDDEYVKDEYKMSHTILITTFDKKEYAIVDDTLEILPAEKVFKDE